MKRLYKFYFDYGRMGGLSGLFAADDEEISALDGKRLYFGEALGKHSEVYGDFSRDMLEVVDEDPTFVNRFYELLPYGAGTTPFDGIDENEEDD